MPELRGTYVSIRPLRAEDVDRLTEILSEPEVAHWFGPLTRDDIVDEYLGGGWHAVEEDGALIGTITYEEEDDPQYRRAGIDVGLATSHHARGRGQDAVRTLARWLIEERGHHRLTIDPAADNARAIHCYERVGFKRVGVMRRYEKGPDGWRDGLLMDLLADELTQPVEGP